MNIKPLLKIMAEKKASDLFLSPFSPIKIKIDGVIRAVNNTVLDVASVKAAAMSIMTQSEKEQLIETGLDTIAATIDSATFGYWVLLPCYIIIFYYAFWGH